MWKKIVLGVLAAILVISGIGLFLASNYFYGVAIARNDKGFLDETAAITVKDEEEREQIRIEREEWLTTVGYEDLFMNSRDGLQLHGIYIPGNDLNVDNVTVVLAHGYSGNAKGMISFAQYYHSRYGYNILMPDDRGHGESEGDYIGMGWPDRIDYLDWISKMIDQNGKDSQIIVHGVSMGGATVAMLSGETLPEQVKFLVEDCGYTSAWDIFEYQLNDLYSLPAFPILNATSVMTKIRAGYLFDEASAVEQVKKATLPMIFVHGSDDTFVPTEMVYQLYDAAPVEKELLIVEGAQHGNAFSVDQTGTYKQLINTYIQDYIDHRGQM
ncbi:alpha/beta hydrolase [Culicoidibacter larvae]|uniref:Alpha/beta hydrolase n=1 Tax=Culicoidibacter larvae TaxID=2579976 RepID=A0A5R8QCD4_9FIRM|nr:alpha/beta hydrolase [Culicoidibacter larvae]TLG74229.1 alpha/beta hydrolase [Culicoidibacter larvae]